MKKSTILGLAAVLSIAQPCAGWARDVITEQHNVAVAERVLEKAQSEYDGDAERVRVLKERIAQQQSQLSEAEKKVEASRKRLAQAQEEYDKQQKILEQAWKNK